MMVNLVEQIKKQTRPERTLFVFNQLYISGLNPY